ncbi:MAG: hypothetical protein P1U56_11990 [Saprospiraceae bacterium]|nr:hypothetical protein [Saprospiraceae bacterium]
MKIKTKILAFIVLFFAVSSLEARVDPEKLQKMKDRVELAGTRMDCQPAQSQYDLEINNVRARLLTGGDVWWDLQEGRYIVPKPAPGFPEVSSIFAGGVWIGGVDPNGSLKLAGVTYRQGNATDFYAGPLDENGETDLDACEDWDDFFIVKGDNILRHIAEYDASVRNGSPLSCDSIPDDVKYWPGKGNPFFNEKFDFPLPDQNLGNFWDEDGDGNYNPCNGDFPVIDIRDCEPDNRKEARELLPDEMVFWVYNDNGGPHRLSQATAIQMEVQVQAFAYATNDEINDMTFYRFKLINKATDDIRDCYFAMWVDADLGCSEDDYIGCDVGRSLGYVYNEDAADGSPGTSCPGGVETYGLDVPILGVDYFRGPRGPKIFCGENPDGTPILCDPPPGTGEQDTLVELGMTSFLYQNRGVSNPPEATQDPDIDFEFYNILRGQWKDGTAVTFGNSGFDPASTDSIRYVFPDPPNDETGWSMCTADLPFDDRRTVQATGPLLLQPGAKNELIIGAVFVPNIDYPCPDISRLQFADDLAQALFDNCFDITDGPDAPDMFAVELDRQLILVLSNDTLIIESNNAKEEYSEKDLQAPIGVEDSLYRFEGYKIYQLANPNVTVQELDNIDQARLIRQVDVKNGVDEIYNWIQLPNPDPSPSALPNVFVPERQVAGGDKGISHSFNVTIDQFANTDRVLVNHKNYYYTVLAYGYNNYAQFDPINQLGQKKSYLEGRRNVRTYTFTPRPIVYQELQTAYGQEAPVTRIEGIGTGFNALDMADGEAETILDGSFDGIITYKSGNGPINPKVIDPLNIKNAQYRLEIVGEYEDASSKLSIAEGARWNLTNLTTSQVIASEKTIEEINEQIIYGEGFSISVNQVGEPGDMFNDDNGAIAQSFEYADDTETNWWNAVPAFDGVEIVVDEEEDQSIFVFPFVDLEDEDDPDNALSRIDNGFFIPMKSARWRGADVGYITPAWKENQGFAIAQNKLRLKHLNNVDIVFTSDKSKWSKCIVVETAVPDYLQAGLATIDSRDQFELRASPSIDENGNQIEGEGMSYFPGYAIDVETGERLNIFFGENSIYRTENDTLISQGSGLNINTGDIGADMIWNPSTDIFTAGTFGAFTLGLYNSLLAGQHFIYVTRQEYDGCETLADQLGSGGLINKINGVSFITWTAIPTPQEPLLSLEEGLIPNDLTVKLRVTSPFNKEINAPDLKNPSKFEAVGELPVYEFAFTDVEAQDIIEENYSNALDNVRVVPNPYYAYSEYEQGQFDNVVKVTNLPANAVVTIYTLDGKFIQQFNRAAEPTLNGGINPALTETQIVPSIEWNLKNNKGIPVASGVYIFHISAPDLGIEKSVKWFGVNRRFDPTGL